MDHSMHAMHDMDHGHSGHGDMDMGDQCSMNMIFTWSSKNLCIIFRQWRITGPLSLLFSLILIVLLTAGYEGVRHVTRKYEAAHNQRLNAFVATTSSSDNGIPRPVTADLPTDAFQPVSGEGSPLLVGRDNRAAVARRGKFTLAALYAIQVFYSFFIMLLFMTYNGSVMLAVAVGAFVGYLAFADGTSAQKTVACH
ncbi:hypothetical protein N7509_004701 [Penicillium cosmopolitanum]|uniref:Copper transport protein n=1 Tax=Penicillium cosmopolitanum TaxID=1131564 RepID=A0A9X0B9C5_9EURO|nr:uncharacterized protein N7509_004701 [Penicillium cosmopolitanum]KAJ5396588.1 hypothetical protein N7509_004701 [Penicillium cosmopolitanum]